MSPGTRTQLTGIVAEVTMPRLSDSMQDGTIVRWLAQNGTGVTAGEEIVEIETDKATMGYEADATGVLRQLVGEGATVPVGTPIAEILSGEDQAGAGASQAGTEAHSTPAPRSAASSAAEAPRRRPGINASSIARRFADRLSIDLAHVSGSGPRGRVLKADVRTYHERQIQLESTDVPQAEPPRPPSARPDPVKPPARLDSRREPFTRTQELIAKRMAESKSTIPEFTIRMRVDMERCVELREELKAAGCDSVPSLNDVVIRAVALALRAHPRINASYRDGEIELHGHINVGMAVAAPGTLVVPTIFDADVKSVSEISRDTRRLSEAARAGTLTPRELTGGTFTVSNLGTAGVDGFTAVINPPQIAILAVGRVARRPAVVGDELRSRWQMEANLTCDHRVIYGADGAAFLDEVRQNLELPLRML